MQGSCERRNKRQHLQSQQARRRDQTHMEQRECGKMKGDHERKKKPKKKKKIQSRRSAQHHPIASNSDNRQQIIIIVIIIKTHVPPCSLITFIFSSTLR